MTPHQQLVALAAIPGNDNPLADRATFSNMEEYSAWKQKQGFE